MKKFKPKDGEKYWYIDGDINLSDMQICHDEWVADESWSQNFSNCFRTRKEAKASLDKILRILK